MATEVELVYKGWLKKSSVSNSARKKSASFLRSSNNWKKKFFFLLKRTEDDAEVPYLEFHDKECTVEVEPKGSLRLWPNYRIEKKHDASGKTFVFEVKTPDEMYRLQAENETMMDLWVFYCQIQTKLRMDFPGHFFEVMPDDSDAMRRVGAKGSKCILHISPWGLTLALKRTKSLLAQWPLPCIRMFECSESGDFSIDAGRSAPMGEAQYIFKTAQGDDGQMYDLLDDYTNKLEERKQIEDPSRQPQPATEEEVAQEYEQFRLATFGLLPGTKPRTSSLNSPSASISVPMGSQRPLRQPLQELPAVPVSDPQLRRNATEPALPKQRPPLPPRNYPNYEGVNLPHSSSAGALPQTYASPYDHEDTATLEGACGGALRSSATESEMMAYSGIGSSGSSQKHLLRSHSLGRTSGLSPYEDMKNSPHLQLQMQSPYENTARRSYPNSSGGISVSPSDMILGGFANPAFIMSPQQSLSKSPWYHDIRAGYGHQYMQNMQNSEIMHTYFDPQSLALSGGAAAHAASPPMKPQLRIAIPPEGGTSLKRSHSFDDMFGRMSLASSIGSPLLDPLDLAHGMIYASPRLSVGLPKTPIHTEVPAELNTYIGTPHRQMLMPDFPHPPNFPPIEENPQYEQMSQQMHAQQSFNNNNHGMSVPNSGEHYMLMHRHSQQAGLSAPLAGLAVLATAMPAGSGSMGRMKRSHSEADLLDCKKVQESSSGYMTMQGQAMASAAYMDMQKGYLAKLRAAAQEAAQRQKQGNSLKADGQSGPASSETSPYMSPRNVLRQPEQIMTQEEMDQTIDTFATSRRKKSGAKISQFFGHSKTAAGDKEPKSGSNSPSQSPRKFSKSPSQALIGRMKRSPKKKKQKMSRSRSEPDLQNIASDSESMDTRKASFGSKTEMKRTNSDFDLLDDNVSVGSADSSVASEPGDRLVYIYRKRFQTKDDGSSSNVSVPQPTARYPEANGQACKPASHSMPSNVSTSPTKKKFQLKMFRQSKSKNAQSPVVSSTESSPDLSRASEMPQPSPSVKPKLSKLKIPNSKKSFSTDSGIVPSESHKSFGKRRSLDKPIESKSTFYVSHDQENVTELTHRPLPSLPRGVKPPNASQMQFAHLPRIKPPSPARPVPVPIPQVPAGYKAGGSSLPVGEGALSPRPVPPIPTEDELEAAEAAAATSAGGVVVVLEDGQRCGNKSSNI